MLASLTIARRFRGPRTSANGGYAAGLLAQALRLQGGDGEAHGDEAQGVEVTLRLPPPLERPLTVTRDGERVLLLDGDALVAEARRGDPAVAPPVPPTFAEAAEAAGSAGGWGAPVFDECFVCGSRPEKDGLEIHAGRVPGATYLVATTWIAREVRPEIVWAAIDCPGAYALRGAGAASRCWPGSRRESTGCPRRASRASSPAGRSTKTAASAMPRPRSTGRTARRVAVSRQLWIEPARA